MLFQTIHDAIEVEARFGPKGLRPLAFVWQGQRRVVRAITCAWSERDGTLIHRCFTVTDGDGCYALRFDPRALRWYLMTVALDG